MEPQAPELVFGLRGWRYAQWVGGFYPEDLPQDWWFSYYSNEFRAVLLPFEDLAASDPGQLREWMDDADERFEFYAEVPLNSAWLQMAPRLEALQAQLHGIYLRHVPACDPLKVKNLLSEAAALAPLIVDWRQVDEALAAVLRPYRPGCYFLLEKPAPLQCDAPLALAEIRGASGNDLKNVRALLEACLSVRGATKIGVFFSGDAPDYNLARHADMIYQMLA